MLLLIILFQVIKLLFCYFVIFHERPCHTSREPYPEEVDGRHYYFMEVEQFEQMTNDVSFSYQNNL